MMEQARTPLAERLESLLRVSPAVLYTADVSDPLGTIFISETVRNLTGYAPHEFVERPGFWVEHIHPDDWPRVRTRLDEIFTQDRVTLDYRFHCQDGVYRWLRDTALLIRDDQGRPSEIVGAWMDISTAKEDELRLRLQAEILANSTEGVSVVGLDDLRIRYANPRFEAMFGYPPGALLGQEISLVNAEHGRSPAATAQAIAESLRQDGVWRGEVLNQRQDGTTFWSYAHIAMRELPSWGPVAISAQSDISSIKEAEFQVRQSESQLHALAARLHAVREEERTRLAREVHDVLGQLLTALTMDIAWLCRRLTQVTDEPLRATLADKLSEMGQLTEGMIRSVQAITSELRPSVLDNLGLGAAIRFETGRFERRTELVCAVTTPDSLPPLDPDKATGMFRVFQEVLTNIARHAAATQVDICLNAAEDGLVLEVADNGRGITLAQRDAADSMGLLGMRERAAQMGGRLDIQGSPHAGTRVILRVPL